VSQLEYLVRMEIFVDGRMDQKAPLGQVKYVPSDEPSRCGKIRHESTAPEAILEMRQKMFE
jgi:hypothetical protein